MPLPSAPWEDPGKVKVLLCRAVGGTTVRFSLHEDALVTRGPKRIAGRQRPSSSRVKGRPRRRRHRLGPRRHYHRPRRHRHRRRQGRRHLDRRPQAAPGQRGKPHRDRLAGRRAQGVGLRSGEPRLRARVGRRAAEGREPAGQPRDAAAGVGPRARRRPAVPPRGVAGPGARAERAAIATLRREAGDAPAPLGLAHARRRPAGGDAGRPRRAALSARLSRRRRGRPCRWPAMGQNTAGTTLRPLRSGLKSSGFFCRLPSFGSSYFTFS